jgi:protein involved in polysaccharide export with SLBB domain
MWRASPQPVVTYERILSSLTLDQLRDALYARLRRVYSGVKRGASGTVGFDTSVANMRANQAYVVGEIARPGACHLSSLGTVLTALYAAGRVTDRAYIRPEDLRRGDRTIATPDLSDHLIHGEQLPALSGCYS